MYPITSLVDETMKADRRRASVGSDVSRRAARPLLLAVALVMLAVGIVAPAMAQAGELRRDCWLGRCDGQILFRGDDDADRLSLWYAAGYYWFAADSPIALPGPSWPGYDDCHHYSADATRARCPAGDERLYQLYVDLGGGDDVLSGDLGPHYFYAFGREGNDSIQLFDVLEPSLGGPFNRLLHGGPGNDRLLGDDNLNQLNGAEGDDWLDGEAGADALIGGTGVDTVSYAGRATPVSVTVGDSEFNDGGIEDALGGSRDRVFAGVENVIGGRADDSLVADDPANSLAGGYGRDYLSGGHGDDSLWGGPDDDRLNGGPDRDVLRGAEGADELVPGTGTDTVDGGAGAEDLVNYSNDRTGPLAVSLDNLGNDGDDANRDGVAEEGDNVRTTVEDVLGGSGNDLIIGSDGPNRLTGVGGDDRVFGRGGDDLLGNAYLGDVETGADRLDGSAGADLLLGGSGPDALRGGPGRDNLTGQAGRDRADYSASSTAVAVTIDGVANDGADANGDGIGDEGDNVATDVEDVAGGSGNDRLVGSEAGNELLGSAGTDTLWGRGGSDRLSGGSHADSLHGGTAADVLIGGLGSDLLYGNAGRDGLYARDGIRDLVNGGLDSDVGDADAIDEVASVP